MSFVRFAALEEIPPGRSRSLRLGLKRIVVFNIEGTLYALEDACAHMKAPLSNGRLRGHDLTCSWHGWVYDVTTGRRKGKDHGCVRTYPLRVQGGEILIDPDPPGAGTLEGPGKPGDGADDGLPPLS